MSRSCRLVEAPVGAGGPGLTQPVALDGVASAHRFPARPERIRHLVPGPSTGTDRSRQGTTVLRFTNRAISADRRRDYEEPGG
jgi:hypothetical protein